MPRARELGRDDLTTFHTLDGVRGLGAILVAYGHMVVFFGGLPTSYPANAFCVDMFFMLSGYILAFVYEPRFAKGMNTTTFMRHRIVRLYPIYALALVLALGVHAFAALGDPEASAAAVNAFGWQALMLPGGAVAGHPDMLYPLNPPAWTLFVELLANLVFVLIWRWLTTPRLIALILVSAVALIFCVSQYGKLDMGWTWPTLAGGMARGMFGFFVGVLIFRLNGSPTRSPTRVSLLAIMGMALMIPLSIMPQSPDSRIFVELGVVLIGGPLMIHVAQSVKPPRFLIAVMAPLGAMSYAIYMLHFPMLELLVRLDWRTDGAFAAMAPWSGLAMLLVVIAMAGLADRYYDLRARLLMNEALKRLSRTARRVSANMMRP